MRVRSGVDQVSRVILVETLVPLGLTVGDTLRLVRDLAPRDIGVRILAGSILVDTSNPGLPAARQLLGVLKLADFLI